MRNIEVKCSHTDYEFYVGKLIFQKAKVNIFYYNYLVSTKAATTVV